MPRRIILSVISPNQRSTWLSQELLVGVKGKWKRRRFLGPEPALYLGAFMGAVIVDDQMNVQLRWHGLFQLAETGSPPGFLSPPASRTRTPISKTVIPANPRKAVYAMLDHSIEVEATQKSRGVKG
ncbi:MAG: hypothetical protein ACR2HX_20375 [Pyrinomonadaceae bacterium]